jgi:pyoverdine/dityrosine biosynthesis protein Dit1
MKMYDVYIDRLKVEQMTAEQITALSIKENLLGVLAKQDWSGCWSENVPINEKFFELYKNSPCVHLTKSKALIENMKSFNT